MAAQAFSVFKLAKKNLGNTTINLSSGNYKLVLWKSAAAEPSVGATASTWASLKTDGIAEVTEAGGYSSSGEALVNVSWTLSANEVKFDAQDLSLSASADITSIKGCLIRESAGDQIVCFSTLTATPFAVSSGNKLIIQFAASGIFVLS